MPFLLSNALVENMFFQLSNVKEEKEVNYWIKPKIKLISLVLVIF